MQLIDTLLSTASNYLQFNYIHHFNGFFLDKIWLLNKLKLEECVGGGLLSVPDKNSIPSKFMQVWNADLKLKNSSFDLESMPFKQHPQEIR